MNANYTNIMQIMRMMMMIFRVRFTNERHVAPAGSLTGFKKTSS